MRAMAATTLVARDSRTIRARDGFVGGAIFARDWYTLLALPDAKETSA